MFQLTNQIARVAHVNLREETHGDEKVLACDLRIEAKMHNDFLAQLHPDLKASLYQSAAQADLDVNHLPKLRYPLLATPLKWEGEIVGGKVTMHAPISDDDLAIFCDVNELRLSPQDGGTVIVSFRTQFLPDGDQAARVPLLLGKMVEISVAKPVAGEGGDLIGDGDDGDDDDGDGDDSEGK